MSIPQDQYLVGSQHERLLRDEVGGVGWLGRHGIGSVGLLSGGADLLGIARQTTRNRGNAVKRVIAKVSGNGRGQL